MDTPLKPKRMYPLHVNDLGIGLVLGLVFAFNFWLGLTWNDKELTDLRPFYLSFNDGDCPEGKELAYVVYPDGESRRFCAQVRPKVKL